MIDRGIVTVSGTLGLSPEPGVAVNGAIVTFTGSLGVRSLSKLIEEATALRDELSEAIG